MLKPVLKFARLLPLALLLVHSTDSAAGLREIVPRPQQMGPLFELPMMVTGTFYLVVPDNPTADELLVQQEVVRLFQERSGRTPIPVEWSDYQYDHPPILLGLESRFPQLASALDSTGIAGLGMIMHAEEYQLFVDENRILLMGEDYRALRWGALSLMYLLGEINGTLTIDRVYIRDWPDFPKRVTSVNSPMRNQEQYDLCEAILDTAYACKMNEVEWNNSDTGLPPEWWPPWSGPFYFSHAPLFSQKIHDRGMKLLLSCDDTAIKVDDLSWQEPIPITGTPMRVTSGGFTVIPGGYNITVPNGGFESWSGSQPASWGLWRDSLWSHFSRDNSIRHSGSSSIRMQNVGSSLALRQWIPIQPYGWYNLKFWLKTSGYSGYLFIDAQGNSPVDNSCIMLTQHIRLTNSTQDWTLYTIPFSSYHLDEILLLVGLRDLTSGTAWLDDVSIEAADFTSMVRRPEAPLNVYEEPGHILRTEGVDYRVVETYSTSYSDYVRAPRLERLTGGALALNDQVTVDWGAAILFQNVRRTVCFSMLEPLQYYQERVRQADSLINPDGFKIHINEVSYAGHCQLCQSRNLTPAQLIGQYCNQMFGIIRAQSPDAAVRIYGDPFDAYNYDSRAMPAYTRPWTTGENGEGSLQQLDPDVEIMMMSLYSTDDDSTFIYYDQNGYNSVVAVTGDQPLAWSTGPALTARKYPGCQGLIVYSWNTNWYYNMPVFAAEAWNTGPYLVHTPVQPGLPTDSVTIAADIWSDALGSTPPTIQSATLHYRWLPSGAWIEIPLQSVATDRFAVTVPPGGPTVAGLEYRISATDSRLQTRTAPAGGIPDFYTVNFSSSTPSDLERRYIEVEHTEDDLGDYLLIEWPQVAGAQYYEVHLGSNPEFGDASRTMAVRQDPDTPRYLMRKEAGKNFASPAIHVFCKSEHPVGKRAKKL